MSCSRFNSISQISGRSLLGLRKLQQLMVHGNNIHALPDGAFRDLGSLKVHLPFAGISCLKVKTAYCNTTLACLLSLLTFRFCFWLLQMLKISYNKLTEINRRTLHGLWSLTRLHLDHNRLESIQPDAFQGLTSLRLLQLEGNRLQQLHPSTFTTFTVLAHFHISTLQHLQLSDNGLQSLPRRLVETMPQLEALYLHGNPWSCDCNMRWLQDWERTSPG